MKKLLGISALAMMLAACSSSHDRPQPPQAHGGHAHNPQIEAALKACHEAVGQTKDQAKFETCMKEKGFEKPADHPKQVSEQADNAKEAAAEQVKSTKAAAKKNAKKVKKAASK